MIVHNEACVRPLLGGFGDLRRVDLLCYRPITDFVVPDVGLPHTTGDQVVLALTPNALPSVEQVEQNRLL